MELSECKDFEVWCLAIHSECKRQWHVFGYLRKISLFFLLCVKNGLPIERGSCSTLLQAFHAYSQRSSFEKFADVLAAGGRGEY